MLRAKMTGRRIPADLSAPSKRTVAHPSIGAAARYARTETRDRRDAPVGGFNTNHDCRDVAEIGSLAALEPDETKRCKDGGDRSGAGAHHQKLLNVDRALSRKYRRRDGTSILFHDRQRPD